MGHIVIVVSGGILGHVIVSGGVMFHVVVISRSVV